MNKKYVSNNTKHKSRHWFIHLLIFVVAQLAFFIFDRYSHWTIFNLNPLGEWVSANISHLWDWVNLYEHTLFNLITVVWGLILVIDGLSSFFQGILSRSGK